jgi:para-nitrobenzyl esterase
MNRFYLWAAVLLMLSMSSAFAADPTVEVETGKVSGAIAGEVASFKGIPYAAPPVGSLRWRAPQPAPAWTGVRAATTYGADCMQKPFPGDAAPLGVTPAEDCLYLNVWAPADSVAKPAAKRPVMVWIYGGGFVNGGSSPAVYDGSAFARDGVVLVSFNYRLGRFGFFAHPALSAEAGEGPTGNFGYMDQLAALAWVKRNVASFGGDPGNVTVFGESAGGVSVHMLLTSPLAEGLFQKAIIQSGGGRARLLATPPLRDSSGGPSAEKAGLAFAAAHGAADLKALRALPAEAVVDGLNMASMDVPTYSGPMVDGKVLPVDPADLYSGAAKGSVAKVPVIVGATGADGFFFGGTLDSVLAPFGADKDLALRLYDPEGSRNVMAIGWRAAGDRMFIEPARHVARFLSGLGQPTWLYRYSYVAESMRSQWPGTPHATEIPFFFDTVEARYGADLKPADEAAAKAAHAYWVAFAKTGKPDPAGLPSWPAYRAGNAEDLMDFGPLGPKVQADPLKARLDLAEKAAEGAKPR